MCLEAVGFILAKFEPKRSHGDPIRGQNYGFGTYDMCWNIWNCLFGSNTPSITDTSCLAECLLSGKMLLNPSVPPIVKFWPHPPVRATFFVLGRCNDLLQSGGESLGHLPDDELHQSGIERHLILSDLVPKVKHKKSDSSRL